jgi:hypothetical protein
MSLQAIVERYRSTFIERYGPALNADQWSALNAIRGCRQGPYGELLLSCSACSQPHARPRSCGHRTCNQCQQHSAQQWLDRQTAKQLPVDYFMATFTLPAELRSLAKAHRQVVYRCLMESAATTLNTFGLNKKGFESELGQCAVLHTHTRRLDYHPHVHMVVPGGGVHRGRREWRTITGRYLFNGRALANVFRARMLKALSQAGLMLPKTPQHWVVQCQKIGKGKQALQYLSRYLYRGVISNNNLLNDDGTNVTFQYVDSKTKVTKTRTLPGETFVWLILQHVLPKGFRRARDYGFLHGNAKALRRIVQWVFRVSPAAINKTKKVIFRCHACHAPLNVVGFRPAKPKPG